MDSGRERSDIRRKGRSGAPYVAHLVLLTTVSCFALDALFLLRVPERLYLDGTFYGRWTDYVGLLTGDLQAGVALVLLGSAAAAIASRLPGSRGYQAELLAILAVGLLGVFAAVSAVGLWMVELWSWVRIAWLPGLVGLCVWLALRRIAEPTAATGLLLTWLQGPAILLGLIQVTVLTARDDHPWIACLCAALAIAYGAMLASVRGRTRLAATGPFVPTLAAVWFASASVVESSTCAAELPQSRSSGTDRPSIALVVLDTVRADHLELYGHGTPTMPSLARWAEGAVVFDRAVSPAGWTPPAHASFLSGLTASQHGIHLSMTGLRTRGFEGTPYLFADLAEQGYTSVAVLSNHLALPEEIEGCDAVVKLRVAQWKNGSIGAEVDRRSPLLSRVSERLGWRMPYLEAEAVTDIALRSIGEARGPVFLMVNYLDAHAPLNPPAWAIEALGGPHDHIVDRYGSHGPVEKRWSELPPNRHEHMVQLYDASLRGMDPAVGRLLEGIETHLGPDTLVIVVSDHGEELGEHGRIGHDHGLHQSLIHVPLLVRAPGLAPGRVPDVVETRRLYHLMRAAAHGHPPDLALLRVHEHDGALSERYPSAPIAERFGPGYLRPYVSLVRGQRKVVGPSKLDSTVHDVSDFDGPVVVDEPPGELGSAIDRYWESERDRRQEGQAVGAAVSDTDELSAEMIERLRALGYLDH